MARHPFNIRIAIGILMTAFVLTACKGLFQSDKPALNVWWLQPVTVTPGVDVATAPATLALDLTAVPGLDSGRILALSSDGQLKPYAGARWVDELPGLVESLVTRSLNASSRFEVVQHGRSGAAGPDCELRLELTEFFADLEAGGRTRGVSVEMGGNFHCGADETHGVASRAYVGVDAERMSEIVAAFQKALDKVTLDIIKQIDIKQ